MRIRQVVVIGALLLPATALVGQESERFPRMVVGPMVGLAANSPEGFSCRHHASAIVRLAADIRLSDRLFASGGVSTHAGLDEMCDIQPVEVAWPANGFQDIRTPREPGLEYVSMDLRLGTDWLQAGGPPRVRTSAGISWIPDKDVFGLVASAESHSRIRQGRTRFVIGVDLHFLRVPYRLERRQYEAGTLIGEELSHPKEWAVSPILYVGIRQGFGSR